VAIISEKNIDIIPINKPYLVGTELEYIGQASGRGHLSGNGCRANSTFRKNLYFKKLTEQELALSIFKKK
jgi:hypothetical protein